MGQVDPNQVVSTDKVKDESPAKSESADSEEEIEVKGLAQQMKALSLPVALPTLGNPLPAVGLPSLPTLGNPLSAATNYVSAKMSAVGTAIDTTKSVAGKCAADAGNLVVRTVL